MLYWKDGKNLGVEYFGEVWNNVPNSCYKDLLPSLDKIKIKCEDCGHEYTLEEVSIENFLVTENRDWIKFLKSRDMDETCCKYFTLIWNVIL